MSPDRKEISRNEEKLKHTRYLYLSLLRPPSTTSPIPTHHHHQGRTNIHEEMTTSRLNQIARLPPFAGNRHKKQVKVE